MLKANVVRHITLGFLAIPVVCFSNALAEADLSWLQHASDCQTFSDGVVSFHQSLAQKSDINEDDRANLRRILKEACSQRFSTCGFSFCKDQEADSKVIEAPLPAPAPSAPEEPVTRRAQFAPAIVTDPLAWLDQPLQCEDLVDQIKARYAPLGGYADLPSAKKDELGKVLDVACSERFSHCHFPSCASDKQASRPVDTKRTRARLSTPAVEIDSMLDSAGSTVPRQNIAADSRSAEKHIAIEQLYAQKTEQRRLQIERAIAEEKAKGVAWKVFSIPGEMESRVGDSSMSKDGETKEKRQSGLGSSGDSGDTVSYSDRGSAKAYQDPSSRASLGTPVVSRITHQRVSISASDRRADGQQQVRGSGRVAPQRVF